MQWTPERFVDTLAYLRKFGDDTTLIECKRASHGLPKSLGPTLSAFANMPDGGTIVLGVDERTGFQVTGVDDPAAMEKALVNYCRQAITPAPQLEFVVLTVEGSDVLVVTVVPLLPAQKPALYRGKAYLRQADGDYEMNANDLRILAVYGLHERERPNADFAVVDGADESVLDSDLLAAYLRDVRAGRRRLHAVADDNDVLELTAVTDGHGQPRLAGLYALGVFPQAIEPSLGVTAAVRGPHTGRRVRVRNSEDFDGPLPVLLESTVEWLLANTSTDRVYLDNGHMVDRPEFPPLVFRELVANALVHRDLGNSLTVGKRVEIRVTARHVIITNPGGLRGVSVDQLGGTTLAKVAVNQHLYQIAKCVHTEEGYRVIEGEGGGLAEVLAALREAELPPPVFIDRGVDFTVLLRRGPRFTEDEQAWLAGLSDTFTATQKDLLVRLLHEGGQSLDSIYAEYSTVSEYELDRQVSQLSVGGWIDIDEDSISLAVPVPGWAIRETDVLGPPVDSALTSDDRDLVELAHLGRNVPRILAALPFTSPALSVHELVAQTGLSVNQVRYGLNSLVEAGYVAMDGGRGTQATTYRALR